MYDASPVKRQIVFHTKLRGEIKHMMKKRSNSVASKNNQMKEIKLDVDKNSEKGERFEKKPSMLKIRKS